MTSRMGRTGSLVVAAFTSGALACGSADEPARKVDPATSALQSAQYTGDVVRQLGRAMSFDLSDGSMLGRLLGGFLGQSSSAAGTPASVLSSPLPHPVLSRLEGTPALRSMHPALSLMTQEENFDDTAADLEALLQHRLLAASNVESSTGTEVTYLLKGDPTCRPLPSKIAEGAADVVDAGCASDLEKLQVRIVVRGDGDGYRYQVLMGPPRHELSVIIVHSDLLGWESDLYQSWQASDYAKTALGQASDPLPLSRLQGRVKAAVQKLGEEKAAIRFSVLEPLDLQGKPADPFGFAMAKADPVFAVTGDGATDQLTINLGVPRTDVRAPWDPKNVGAKNTDLHVALGGLHGQTTLVEGAEEASFTGLGIGASFVEVRSSRIFDLAFNPQHGNKMDLKVKSLPADGARFEIAPRFDLALGLKLAAIAAELSAMPPAHFLDEIYSVSLAGGSPSVVETGADMIKVVAGSLTLSSSASASTVTVPAGQCLAAVDPAPGAHPLLGALAAGSCQ